MSKKTLSVIVLLIILFNMVSCSPLKVEGPTPESTEEVLSPTGAEPAPAQNEAAEPSSYEDPFDYCAAVGTIDMPDDRYSGTEMPEAVIEAMIEQGIVSADTPSEFQGNAVWRCMNGSVWVCHFGANLPCLEKADTGEEPSEEMNAYCQENPTAEYLPAYVTGRATVYEWKCSNGEAEIVKQIAEVDARGYLADFWVELSPTQ